MFLLLILSGCDGKRISENYTGSGDTTKSVAYANGFSLTANGANITVTVKNPWQHARDIEFSYFLSDTLKSSLRVDKNHWKIKTPVQKVICLSTTHIGFIEFINKIETITGISGKDYVVNAGLRNALSKNTIFDVGYDESLDFELILKLKPDVVFAYGISASVTNTVNKLAELGIPVILIGEYLEQDPLAKMEWIKVFAACYGLDEQVSGRFDSVANSYNLLKELAGKSDNKPSVLLGLPWRGNWYISGSKSYMARLINDAGGNYIWNNLDFNESRPFGLEKIYENALTADFWINPGEAQSIKDILSVDERFGALPAIKNDRIYNNNNFVVSGGNAFFETGVAEPDIILSDLIAILHPQLLPSHKLKYYRKLQ